MTTSVGSVKGTNGYPPLSGGAIPTPTLHFSRCSLKDVSQFIKTHHYSHTHPGGISHAFRLDMDGVLSGACVFGYMAGNPLGQVVLRNFCDDPSFYRELMRLVLLDEVPYNSETRFVAWCLRWLRDNTDMLAIVSFADPKFGHSGTIYHAGNWVYTGLQKEDRPRLIIDGKEIHPRQCLNKFKTSSVPKLVAAGHRVQQQRREPKHRFVFLLRPDLQPYLKYPRQQKPEKTL